MKAEQFDFLIGMYEAVAWELIQENGFIPRITRRDGIPKVVTRDFKSTRVNLHIEDNKVVHVDIG